MSKTAMQWNTEGDAFYHQGKYSKALECYDEAIKLDSKYKLAWNNKGLALNNLGQYNEAIQCYDEAIKLDSKNKLAWNNKGYALDDLGKFNEAIECFDEAIKLDSKYKLAWNNKGLALNNLGSYFEALQCFDEAIKLDSKYKEAWNNKGDALNNLGKYNEAIQCYDEVIKFDSNYSYAWANKGYSLINLEKLEEGLTCLNKSLQIDSKNYIALNYKGIYFEKKGDYDQAIKFFDESLQIDPNYKEAKQNKNIVNEKNKVKLFLTKEEYNESVEQILQELEKLGIKKLKDFEDISRNDLDSTKLKVATKNRIWKNVQNNFETIKPKQINISLITPSDLNMEKEHFSEGNFGFIYKAIYLGKQIVAKQLKDRNNERTFLGEGEIAFSVHHPHIIQCYGYTEINGSLFLLFEYAKHGPLDKYLQQNKPSFNELLSLSIQLTSAIVYLHSINLIHRDLAGDNVLVSEDSEGVAIKLSDFGLSRVSRRYAITGVRGKILFSAPEVLKDLNCYASTASDIYSLGIVLWQIFSYGIEPENEAKYLDKPAACTPELFSIIQDCWNENTQKRPDARTLFSKLQEIQQNIKNLNLN